MGPLAALGIASEDYLSFRRVIGKQIIGSGLDDVEATSPEGITSILTLG